MILSFIIFNLFTIKSIKLKNINLYLCKQDLSTKNLIYEIIYQSKRKYRK